MECFSIRPRPVTSASMAKRLVSTALGIRNTVSPEQRKIERQMLADAKGLNLNSFSKKKGTRKIIVFFFISS